MVPYSLAFLQASMVSSAVVSDSAAKMPPVWNQRAPWLHLAGGGEAAVGGAFRAADAEAALGEIEAVADVAADAVEGLPLDEAGIDAALQDEVLDQAADIVLGKSGDHRGALAEAAAEAAGDVVFAAAFPRRELARGADPAVAGIEAEHDFTQRDDVELAGSGGA